MFGLLLRSELLQGSAVRTWNCVLNIANFFRYKFNSLRQPVMPRSRRRHHSRSRSRSRSHSHDRDREPKRRRLESPDNSHHRRSVSAEKEVTADEDSPMETTLDDTSPVEITSSPESPKENTNEKEESTANETKHDTKELPEEIINKTITPKKITPKKVMSPAQKKKYEEKIKLRQEKEEQRRKEREEKEERRRKEKEDREEQKRKEKEEREEQKRKEKEEKEELKRKEKEEKDEQIRKKKEEKEEQKRKEKEEKELKAQQETEEKNKEKKKKEQRIQKEKAAFANFFRKSASSSELKKPEPEKTSAFMPFAVKSDMRLAPICRRTLSEEQKQTLVDKLTEQLESNLYLDELKKGKQRGISDSTWPVLDDSDDVLILEDSDFGEKVEEEPKAKKMRAKLLKFHENRRPAYFGTWRKKSKSITPRKPLTLDKDFFDYEVDSDDDWEEEEPGESLAGSDDEEKDNEEKDDYEVDNEFFVPHGYLSDEEIESEEKTELSMETQKEKLKILQEEFDQEMKSKTEKIKPRLIGCIWENKLAPKVQDAIHKFLEDRMMIVSGTIHIQKRELANTNIKINPLKSVRTPLTKELVPYFLQLIHGNTRNQAFLVNEFYNFLASKNLNTQFSKASLLAQLKQLAKWKKCPDEGEMFNKYCWYVDEDIRSQYEISLPIPNNWSYISPGIEENGSRKTVVS